MGERMEKIKILFFIHDLGHGGAEKVLVNLVNNMHTDIFDITVMALFGGGVNEQFLKPHVKYKTVFKKSFPGNSQVMKLFSPKTLHNLFIKEKYDIEVSYLEGPSARIISGCPNKEVKKACWIHTQVMSKDVSLRAFRGFDEAMKCYESFDKIACVSQNVIEVFLENYPVNNHVQTVFNTNESENIIELSKEAIDNEDFLNNDIKIIGVGSLGHNKGFQRVIPIIRRLRKEGLNVRFFILGEGSMKKELEDLTEKEKIKDYVTFLGYQTNPYKYVAKCDLFVCSSYAEGFSTAATEALIVSTPVCTTNVSGMKEMLGEKNEWGVIVENTDEALYKGIKELVSDSELLKQYKIKASKRGKFFSTEETVKSTEEFLLSL